MAGRSGPPGGLSLCPGPGPRRGRRGSCSPTPSAPLSRLVLIATLKMASRGSGPGEAVQLKPIGLGPSAPRFPAPPAGRMPRGAEHPLWVPGRGQTLSQAPLSGSATWGGRGLGNRGGSLAPSSSHDCVLLSVLPFPAPPGCRPAPPQHQGSREALPRHRLSLRCQALWMRLRASSNFLLEDSWMALWGRSTW